MPYDNIHAAHVLEYYDGVNWIDITAYAIRNPLSAFWGLSDNRPLTLIGSTGQLSFKLDNRLGYFMPETATVLTGWDKGTPIRLILTFDDLWEDAFRVGWGRIGYSYIGATGRVSYIRYRGRVDTLNIHEELSNISNVDVTCVDWLDFAAKYPLTNPQVTNDFTIDQAAEIILTAMPVKPTAQALEKGNFIFPSLFDAVAINTTAYAEFNKLAQSEMAYCYLQHDKINGETFVVENNTRRSGLNTLSRVPELKADSGRLLMAGSATDHILMAGSATDHIIPNLTAPASINNLVSAIDETYANNIVNRLTINTYPKTLDSAPVTLYKLGSHPLKISAGTTKTITGKYRDPVGGKPVSGVSMIQPVITTDYLMFEHADGSGTNLTAFLTIVCNYTSAAPIYTLTNTWTGTGFVTKLHARGYGVYQDDTLTATLESAASQNVYGYQDLTLEQIYQQDTDLGTIVGNRILDDNKAPHLVVNSIAFDANYSTYTMQTFLNMDVGSLVQIIDTQYSINDWFYIQGVSFILDPSGRIKVTWIVKKAASIASGELVPVGVTFHDSSTDGLNFGNIPVLNSLHDFSISLWMNSSANANNPAWLLACADFSTGWEVYYNTVTHLIIFAHQYIDTGANGCYPTAVTILPGNLTHVVITGSMFNPGIPFVMYINGISVAITIVQVFGSYHTAEAESLVIGNRFAPTWYYAKAFAGLLKDCRVYNRILTAAEVTTLYNAGVPNASLVPDGMVFQGPCVRTKELVSYTDKTLTAEDKVLDNVFGVVGTPHGSPISRVF